ncbi:predicted protein [Histoplasma capsulatum var. duboisii H88]|uniref:Predicted protein n=1 Tax=Ajellomyces capsulatus (strain H88) TaxID=544711 RepID=F0UCC1_AJEC8|nr:predicted protein [Histoplasma capsulatum var. duboisii H88]
MVVVACAYLGVTRLDWQDFCGGAGFTAIMCSDFRQANNILPPHQLFVACLQTRFVLQIHAGWHTLGTYGGNVSALHKVRLPQLNLYFALRAYKDQRPHTNYTLRSDMVASTSPLNEIMDQRDYTLWSDVVANQSPSDSNQPIYSAYALEVCPHQSSCKVILTVHPVKNIESSELWSVVVVMGSSPIRVDPGRWVGVDQF